MRKSKVKLGGIRNVENVGNVKHWYNNKRDIQMEKMKQTEEYSSYGNNVDKDNVLRDDNANYSINNIKYEKRDKDLTFYLKCVSLDDADNIEINNDNLDLQELKNIIVEINPNADISENFISKLKLKSKKGGASLLDTTLDISVKGEYNLFNNFIINNYATFDERTRLENIIDNIGATGNITNITIRGRNLLDLQTFIQTNNNSNYTKNINIDLGNSYDFNYNNNVPLSGNNLSYQLQYQHKDYNKNIVEAFQKKFIDNHHDIQNLIDSHKLYISILPDKHKCTINDYTNPNGYRFYAKYFKSNRHNWLDIYTGAAVDADRNRPIQAENPIYQFCFGDAFLTQIKDYYDRLVLVRRQDQHPRLNDIGNTLNRRLNNTRHPINHLSDFHTLLNQNDWNEILKTFETDMNNIIKLAPTIDKEIYCYRGADRHVIENQHDTQPPYNSLQYYQTTRITSFSISFDCAKFFYYSEDLKDYTTVLPEACIYRTTIMRGANLLFIEQLTTCQTEYEFITPSYTAIIDPQGFDNISRSTSTLPTLPQYVANHPNNIKYNNINNRFGISGKLYDQIQSMDIIVIGSPPPPQIPPDWYRR